MTASFFRTFLFIIVPIIGLTHVSLIPQAYAKKTASLERPAQNEGANSESAPSSSLAPTGVLSPNEKIDWNICNETSFMLRLANATLRDGTVKAKGWQTVQPGQCLTEKVERSAPRLLYAESLSFHRGGIREWKGNIPLCVKEEEDFLSEATQDCKRDGLLSRKYLAVKPGEKTTTLIEPADYGDKAEIAGTQRLLRDAGYKITTIDGLAGRGTSRSIDAFVKAEELDKEPQGQALIAALVKAAARSTNNIGLEMCNKGTTRIYSAVGMQQNGNWTSKGWWAIDPDQCVRPITTSLEDLNAHYYALKEAPPTEDGEKPEDLRLRSVATIPAQFCIAESQFSALGREYCFEGGYSVANFRPLPTDKNGKSVTLTDEDFATPAPEGLRR